MNFQNVLRGLITLLIVVLAGLSLAGMAWWGSPPEKLADDATGGRFILGLLVLSSIYGLVVLWKPVHRVER